MHFAKNGNQPNKPKCRDYGSAPDAHSPGLAPNQQQRVRSSTARHQQERTLTGAPCNQGQPNTLWSGIVFSNTACGDEAAAEAAQLAFGSPRDREDAALLLGSGQCPANQSILAALAADQSFSVRRASALATGRLISTDPNPLNMTLARTLAEDKGSDLPGALLGGILQTGQHTPVATEIAQHLRDHQSARIRRMAERIT